MIICESNINFPKAFSIRLKTYQQIQIRKLIKGKFKNKLVNVMFK